MFNVLILLKEGQTAVVLAGGGLYNGWGGRARGLVCVRRLILTEVGGAYKRKGWTPLCSRGVSKHCMHFMIESYCHSRKIFYWKNKLWSVWAATNVWVLGGVEFAATITVNVCKLCVCGMRRWNECRSLVSLRMICFGNIAITSCPLRFVESITQGWQI